MLGVPTIPTLPVTGTGFVDVFITVTGAPPAPVAFFCGTSDITNPNAPKPTVTSNNFANRFIASWSSPSKPIETSPTPKLVSDLIVESDTKLMKVPNAGWGLESGRATPIEICWIVLPSGRPFQCTQYNLLVTRQLLDQKAFNFRGDRFQDFRTKATKSVCPRSLGICGTKDALPVWNQTPRKPLRTRASPGP